MASQTRTVNKGRFENGDQPQASDYIDLIDSFVSLSDTTSQTLNSNLVVPVLGATTVTAATGIFTTLDAGAVSAQTITVSALTALGPVNAATVSAQAVNTSALNASTVSAQSIITSALNASTVSAQRITVSAIDATGPINAASVSAQSVITSALNAATVSAQSIITSALNAQTVSAQSVITSAINANTVSAQSVTVSALVATGTVRFNIATTVQASGGAGGAVPTSAQGYLEINVGGTIRYVPFFNVK